MDMVFNEMPAQLDTQPKSLQAFGLALLAEIALVAGVLVVLTHSVATQPVQDAPVPITLVEDDNPKKEEPKPRPAPQPEPIKQVSKIIPKQPAPPQTPVMNQPTPPLAEVQSDVQTAFADPAPAPVAPPVPVASNAKANQVDEYAGKVHDAVQSAYFYPPAAAAMRFSGRVRLEFILKDAHMVESRVLQSCGIGLFDKAALEAVRIARYPDAPVPLRGQDLHYQIWVELSTHG